MTFLKVIIDFVIPAKGDSVVQVAMLFAMFAVVLALVGQPLMNHAAQIYASNSKQGVDTVVTSSIEPTKTRIVRRSVLD